MNQQNICPHGDTNHLFIASLVEESPIWCPKGALLIVYVIFTYLRKDINNIQLALQWLKEEHAHIEEFIQNAATRKKELDKEMNASSNRFPWK